MTLSPDQIELWDTTEQTPGQPVGFTVLEFQAACEFDGLGTPTEEDIRDLIESGR